MKKKRLNECRKKSIAFCLSLVFSLGICFQVPFIKANAKETTNFSKGTSENENEYLIYPVPQDIQYDKDSESFTLPKDINLVFEDGIDEATKNYAKEVLDLYKINYNTTNSIDKSKTNLCIGVNDSKGVVDDYVSTNVDISNSELFNKPDSYLMDIKEDVIVILGKNTDSAFYGVSTLKMILSSFNNMKLLKAKIEDYASVPMRGFIEGFYGGWDYEQRASLMEFAKDYKMNNFVYASKTDAYHTNKWDELYPTEEINEIAELVKIGEETKVRYAWSVHLSGFFKGLDVSNTTEYESRFNKLIKKFEQLYNAGVRKFDILNDDFGGGSHAEVVKLLNRLDNEFIQEKGCQRMVYCPQGYNKSWSGNGDELNALRNLNDTIDIYWTGDDVNSPITQDTVDFLNERTNHKPVFWLNYPVNEHAKSGIYLGDISHYARDNVSGMAGFVSNPSRFAQSNKVALFQLASLNWNNNNYLEGANTVWQDAFKYLQPEVYDSYLTIARNIANAPRSSRVPGFNESEYLKDKLDSVINKINDGSLTANDTEVNELIAEFNHMLSAIEDMRANCDNTSLIDELDPWLKSLKDVATSGKAILESMVAVLNNDSTSAWNSFRVATKAFETKYTYLTAEDLPNVYAEAGSRRLTPFISKVINSVKNSIMPMFDMEDTSFTPSIYAVMGGVEQSDNDNTSKMFDGDESTFATFTVNQEEGDYFGVDLGKVIPLKNLHIVQAKEDSHHDFYHEGVLEYSEDGNAWSDLGTYTNQVRIDLEDLNVNARYVRLKLIKDKTKPYWTYIREFTVNKEEEKQPRVYTNVEALKTTPITIRGKEHILSNLNNVTLNTNEYVGIKFKDISTASKLINKVSETGLTVEQSINGSVWEAFSDNSNLKYLRLINKSDNAVTLNINEFGASVSNLKVDPKFIGTNLTNGIQQGSYSNVFDGDLSTFVWTNEGQTNGDYITFDLGSTSNIYDVKVVTDDGNPRLYNANIQISTDNREWTTIASVVDDNSTHVVPYRYVEANADGKEARYLRILITGDTGYYLKLHEIEINKSVEDQMVSELNSSLSGDVDKIIDKDISTVFTQGNAVTGDDFIEYTVSENTNIDKILLLQEPSKGELKVKTKTGYEKVSDLSESIIDIDTTKYDEVLAIRLEWQAGEMPAIYELAYKCGENSSDDIGVNVENIIISGNEIINLALNKEVFESGRSDGDKNNVNDDNTDTKWDSNFIKGPDADENAWITIDLGEEKNEINQIVVKYFNKIYATNYDVQISSDNQNFETVKNVTKDHNGPTHPNDTIDFENPISARYVRLFFKELNNAAIGNGVGITEFIIMGRYVSEEEVDTSSLSNLIKELKGKDLSKYTKASVEELNNTIASAEKLLSDGNLTEELVNNEVEKLQNSFDSLKEKITEESNIALNKEVEVSGTSNGVKESINDGDKNTKWDSDFIKGDGAAKNAWVVIDLGEDIALIKEFNISYFNLVFPTNYDIQVSNDKESWTTITSKTHEHGGAAHPTDVITLENEVSARYVRFMFNELNNQAAGNGVGINELEIIGRIVNEESELVKVQENDVKEGKVPSDISSFELKDLTNIALKVDKEELNLLVPVKWNTDNFNGEEAGEYSLEGELQLNSKISNPNNLKSIQKIVLTDDSTGENPDAGTELDKTLLQEYITTLENIVSEIDKYESESVVGIEDILKEAKAVKEDDKVTQETIDEVCDRALAAIENAKLKDEDNNGSEDNNGNEDNNGGNDNNNGNNGNQGENNDNEDNEEDNNDQDNSGSEEDEDDTATEDNSNDVDNKDDDAKDEDSSNNSSVTTGDKNTFVGLIVALAISAIVIGAVCHKRLYKRG